MSANYTFSTLCVLTLAVVAVSAQSMKKSVACQGSNLEISCNKGEIIYILDATYGGASEAICAHNYTPKQEICVPMDISKNVISRCAGETECSVTIANKFFGNPCPHVFKYAEVKYKCTRVHTLAHVSGLTHLDFDKGLS